MARTERRKDPSEPPDTHVGLRRPDVPHLSQTFVPPESDPYCPHFPSKFREFLGRRPLVGAESAAHYDGLVENFAAKWKPQDLLQWLQLKQQIDAIWEKMRLQAVKRAILRIAQIDELAIHLERNLPPKAKSQDKLERERLAREVLNPWRNSAEVEDHLEELGTSSDEINARAFPKVINLLETLSGMVASQDRREAGMRREMTETRWMSEKVAALPSLCDLDDDGEEV
jgi:hypothetical protein